LSTRTHAAGLVLGALITLLGAGPAAASPSHLKPLGAGEAMGGRVDRLVAQAQEQRRTRFPVVGGASFGEGQAHFGAGRSGHSHEGQDMFAPAGTPLVAVTGGKVMETGNNGGRGNYVGFYSARTKRTYVYLHMQSPARVKAGQTVRSGQRLGELGCTGSCFGDHLHFEARRGESLEAPAEDPLPFLRGLLRR
jgi:murein DD-endopeptidase MepM/ murein hydrolase activator NlpD